MPTARHCSSSPLSITKTPQALTFLILTTYSHVADIKKLWHRPCLDYGQEDEMNQKAANSKNWITREEEKELYEVVG
jgi:hypothetical protein